MRRSAAVAATVAVCAALTITSGLGASAATHSTPKIWSKPVALRTYAPLTIVSSKTVDDRMTDITITTPYLPDTMVVRVMTPVGYDPSGKTKYPSLYLLHGANYNSAESAAAGWTTPGPTNAGSTSTKTLGGDAEAMTENSSEIVIMPSASNYWYSDWAEPGTNGTQPLWETYFINQLIPWVDANYPTINDKSARAIAGLSMGGYGSIAMAALHPDLFVSTDAFSGAVDNNTVPELPIVGTVQIGATPDSIYGNIVTNRVNWDGHNPSNLAVNLNGVAVTFRIGNGVPGPYDTPNPSGVMFPDDTVAVPTSGAVEALIRTGNLTFDQALTKAGVPHTFDDYGPGTHNWPYFNRSFAQSIPNIVAGFRKGPVNPATFTYTSIDPTYQNYGYRVDIARKVTEFTTLAKVTASGFSLTGSGSATVTTAPRYSPNASYAVKVGAVMTTVTSDKAGRLTIPVDLGASSTRQESAVTQVGTRNSVTKTVSITP